MLKIDAQLNIMITALILPCLLYVGMKLDMKQYIHLWGCLTESITYIPTCAYVR